MQEIFDLINEMSPYLLLGFFLAGLMHAFIPNQLYTKYLSGNSFRSVLYSALFGVPLPLCSCGVIPTAMSLRREGASKGATASFLIATPQTGVDSIIATYSLLGLPFAIIRPLVAFTTALFGGQLINILGDREEAVPVQHAAEEGHVHRSFWERLKEALKYAFVEMMQDIGKWLIMGLVVAGLITVLVPDSFFALFKDNSLLSMLIVLACAIPMYLCATGSIPIAVALMMKGLSPGTALVLLMAGPACNVASILVINKVLGRRTLILYLTAIVGGAILFGLGIDYLLPREWFTSSLSAMMDDCCHTSPEYFNIGCTILMLLLLLNAFWRKYHYGEECSCGHEHGDHCECGHEHHHHGHGHEEHCHCHGEGCQNDGECSSESENGEGNEDITVTFHVGGMNCNHCRTSVEKAILSVPGVETAQVSLEKETAIVHGEFTPEEVMRAVDSIGFEIKEKK